LWTTVQFLGLGRAHWGKVVALLSVGALEVQEELEDRQS
jgi:hypothetical protein